MSNIPTHIILTHILPKLPAKTLLLFKCVCHLWQIYISSFEFINLHLNYSLSLNRNHLLVFTTSKITLFSLPLHSLLTHKPTKLPFPASERGGKDGISVVGCCDGLVCATFLGNGLNVRVLNPSTGVFKDIAPLRLPRRVCAVVYGFGFDHANNDYKIVRLLEYYSSGRLFFTEVCRQVSVCSLKRPDWRVVEWIVPSDHVTDGKNAAVLEKHLVHWLVWCNYNVKKCRIKCFDICKEDWVNDVALPQIVGESDTETRELSVFDGYLCMSFMTDQLVDIWIMKEYGVQDSWIKLLSVTDARVTRSLRVAPVVYSNGRNNVLLSVVSENEHEHEHEHEHKLEHELYWYDIEDGSIETSGFHGIEDCISVNDCIGSLVCVPGGHSFVSSQ